jgi:phosphatidylserine/phosphatidylglycerophosphate/cardiolipin synthase-like enzyme
VNFDNRSFQLHDEVTLCVQSERFAAKLHDAFERDLESSERIDPGEWGRSPRRSAGAGADHEVRPPRAVTRRAACPR